MPTRVFLSYSRQDDEQFVWRLYEDLRASGFDVWFDQISMPSRQLTFLQEIRDSIAATDRMLLVVGPNAVESDYVIQEWKSALELDKCVNPIVRLDGRREDGAIVDGYALIPDELSLIHAEDFRHDSTYAQHLANLIRHLSSPLPPLGKLIAVPNLPPHYLVQRNHLCELRDALLSDLQRPVIVTGSLARIGVHGMGGIGKSVLAAAIAREHAVRRAFPDGILWISVGQHPSPLDLQRYIAKELGDPAIFTDSASGKQKLRDLLRDRAALLILDDVWQASDANELDVVGPRCKLLLTTRDFGLVNALTGTSCQVQLPTEVEGLRILASAARLQVRSLPAQAAEVVRECGRLPLALALCGGMVAKGHVWGRIHQALREARLELIGNRHEIEEQHRSIWRAMDFSVGVLSPDEQRRFAELAVFAGIPATPEEAVLTLWAHTGGLDKLAASHLLVSFNERSLVNINRFTDDSGNTAVRFSLHDLLGDFSARLAERLFGQRANLHIKLLDAYRRYCKSTWHSGPDDGYFLQRLCHHLAVSGQRLELAHLLFDFQWLQLKVSKTLVLDLIYDYDEGLGILSDNDPLRNQMDFVQRSLWLSANALLKCTNQLASQLIGRLSHSKSTEIAQLLAAARNWRGAPWFRPLNANLQPPGSGLLLSLEGINTSTDDIALSADGTRVVSGSNKFFRVWDLRAGRLIRKVEHLGWNTNATAITPDGRTAICAYAFGRLSTWDIGTGKERILDTSGAAAVALTPDGRVAVVGSEEGVLTVWDLETGNMNRRLQGPKAGMVSVAISADARHIVAAFGRLLKAWDLLSEGDEPVHLEDVHEALVYALAVTDDGRYGVSGSYDCTVRVWDLRSGKSIRRLQGHSRPVWDVRVTGDGRYAISGSWDHTVRLWNVADGCEVRTLYGHSAEVNAVAITPDGSRAASASADGTLKVWSLDSKLTGYQPVVHGSYVSSIELTDDGRYSVTAGGHSIKLWNVERGVEVRKLTGGTDWEYCSSPTSRGARLAASCWPDALKIIDFDSGLETCEPSGPVRELTALTSSPNRAEVVGVSYDQTLHTWSLETGMKRRTLHGAGAFVKAVATTADGRWAVSLGDRVTLWDLDDGVPIRTAVKTPKFRVEYVDRRPDALHDKMTIVETPSTQTELRVETVENEAPRSSAWCEGFVAVTSGGRRAVSRVGDSMVIWDMELGSELSETAGNSLAVATEAATAVIGGFGPWLRLLELETGKNCLTLHTVDDVTDVAITPNGRLIAATSWDCTLTVWVWDTGSCAQLATFVAEGRLDHCAFDASGRILVVSDASSRIHFLRLVLPDDPIESK